MRQSNVTVVIGEMSEGLPVKTVTSETLVNSFFKSETLVDSFLMPFENAHKGESGTGAVNISCPSGKIVAVPTSSVLLEHAGKKALWCPNAKVGTSTIYSVMASILSKGEVSNGDARSLGQQTSVNSLLATGRERALCSVDFSFTFQRNPWDRVRSAFLDKINRVAFVPHKKHATFADFLYAIRRTDPRAMNAHWMPVSTRCLTAGPLEYKYSRLYKIEEHFEDSIVEAFSHIGISEAQSRRALNEVGQRNAGSSDHSIDARLKAYHSKTLADMVHEIYQDDIKVGHYHFGQ
jgi:hypothetical protein